MPGHAIEVLNDYCSEERRDGLIAVLPHVCPEFRKVLTAINLINLIITESNRI